MADRVLVMREGHLTGEFARAEATPEAVMFAATAETEGASAPPSHPPGQPRAPRPAGAPRCARARDRHPDRPAARDRRRDHQEPGLPLLHRRLPRSAAHAVAALLVAVGQAIVIITRNVDLSVGSILGLTAYLTGRLFIDVPGIPVIAVCSRRVIFGALLGPRSTARWSRSRRCPRS